MAEKRRHDFQQNNRQKYQPSPSKTNVVTSSRPLPIGTKVWVNISHPANRSLVYLCEARIIRTPRFKAETKYKVLVSGARPFSEKDSAQVLGKLLGMRVLRDAASIFIEEPWAYGKGNEWIRMNEDETEALVRLSVTRIRREPARQSKNNSIKKLF